MLDIIIKNGACFTEEGHHYFKFQSFITHLGNGWKIDQQKIAQKLKDKCKVEFSHSYNIITFSVNVRPHN